MTLQTRRTAIQFMLSVGLLCAASGCDDSDLAGLQGRWSGTVRCFSGESQLNLHLTVEGAQLSGTAQLRVQENNKTWQVRGAAATSCLQDTCSSDRDCPLGLGVAPDSGQELRRCDLNPACAAKCVDKPASCNPCGGCQPCQLCTQCREDWLPVLLTLSDDDVLVPDPELKLWRLGSGLLRGSIRDFCANPETQFPVVELHHD